MVPIKKSGTAIFLHSTVQDIIGEAGKMLPFYLRIGTPMGGARVLRNITYVPIYTFGDTQRRHY